MSTAEQLSLPSPAKLNLFLRVTGQRADDYHELQTVFQLLDWGDMVHLRLTEGAIERSVDLPGVPEQQDLCLKAAYLLRQATGQTLGVSIGVDKQIPLGSGMGGASSNAATVLVGLNALWQCGLDTGELARLALELGADVPVFVRGHSAWAEGVGEKIWPLSLPTQHYVIVMPGQGVSTAEVFNHPGLARNGQKLNRDRFNSVDDCLAPGNDLQPVVLAMRPDLANLVKNLDRWGHFRMTGTGSTFFLPVDGKKQAIDLTSELKSIYNVRAVAGVNRSGLLEDQYGVRPDG